MMKAGGFLIIIIAMYTAIERGVTVEGNAKGVNFIFDWRLYF